MRFRTKIFVAVALVAGLPLISSVVLSLDHSPILLESLESKTRSGDPVYNRVTWFPGWKKDTWMMQQSHQGLNDSFHKWDRLAIVVDKTVYPRTARFYQFEPGPLQWNSESPQRPLRAACFMCHSNGNRNIRPNLNSDSVPVSFWNQSRVFLWNLRMKTYGRVEADPIHGSQTVSTEDIHSGKVTPFRYPGEVENRKLQIQTCIKCHNDSWWGRNYLTRQNFVTIGFMVDHGFMPPLGFHLGQGEAKELTRFLKGLP